MTLPGDNAYLAIVKVCHLLLYFSGFVSWVCLFGRDHQACTVNSPCHQIEFKGVLNPFLLSTRYLCELQVAVYVFCENCPVAFSSPIFIFMVF